MRYSRLSQRSSSCRNEPNILFKVRRAKDARALYNGNLAVSIAMMRFQPEVDSGEVDESTKRRAIPSTRH